MHELAAERATAVVLSSHLMADLERVCDYLVLLVASRVALDGRIDALLASQHRLDPRWPRLARCTGCRSAAPGSAPDTTRR